jgi:hypothetical protein
MEVVGKIKLVSKVIEKGTFKSRNVVVTTDEQYPQYISVQFVQDKCNLLDLYKEGDNVNIGINLRGREWVNTEGVSVYFNTIQGWKINKITSAPKAEVQNPFAPADNFKEEDHDDLPF